RSQLSRESQRATTSHPSPVGPAAWYVWPSGSSVPPAGWTCLMLASYCSFVPPGKWCTIPNVAMRPPLLIGRPILDGGVEDLGAFVLGRAAVGVEDELLVAVIHGLQRCARRDVNEPAGRHVLALGRV